MAKDSIIRRKPTRLVRNHLRPPQRAQGKAKHAAGDNALNVGRDELLNPDCHNQPKPTKLAISRIPEPQAARILHRHIRGESIRKISRAEGRSRECVTRIVKGPEVRQLVERMREEFYGLAYDAIAAVRDSLQLQKDGRVGYRLLSDIGIIPTPAEVQFNAIQSAQPDLADLTPYERVAAQDESGRINPWQYALVKIAEERNEVYGTPLLTTAEILHNHTIVALINEMTGGENLDISLSSPIEWNRLKALAEDVLQGKRAVTDKEIVAVRKQYIG